MYTYYMTTATATATATATPNPNPNPTTDKIASVSAVLVSIVYFVFFVIICLIYDNLIANRINAAFSHHPLLDFVGDNQDIMGYENRKMNINQILNTYRFWSIFVVFCVIIGSNMGIYSVYLKGTQPLKALSIIAWFAVVIVVPIYLICNTVAFVKVFENSIGYSVAKLMYRHYGSFSTFMNTLFTHNSFYTNSEEINVDFGFLFSLFRLDNFGTVLSNIGKKPDNPKYNFHVNTAVQEEDLRYLLRAVVTKNTIGHLSWIYFAAVACTLVSVQYVSYVL
jgi:hypothetical protein